jgi:nucleotide-binding universal stress UspA family protein
MQRSVLSAHDPDAGDTGPVELGRVAARLLGARLVVVVVRPGGSAPERLARCEGGRDPARAVAALRASLHGERAEVVDVTAPSAAAGLHAALAAERPVLAVVGSSHDGEHGCVGLGGTTDRVLTAAACPVAVTPRGYCARRRVLGAARCPVVLLPRADPADRLPAFATHEALHA